MEDDGYEVVTTKNKEIKTIVAVPIVVRAVVEDKGYIQCPTEWARKKVVVRLEDESLDLDNEVVQVKIKVKDKRQVKKYKQFPYRDAFGMRAQKYAKLVYDKTGNYDDAYKAVYTGMYNYLKDRRLFGRHYTLDRLRYVSGQIINNLKDSMKVVE